jgi:ABC-type antimicrobial peptide transport system permease subunit
MELYMRSSSERREKFVALTNEIASSLGYDNGISIITPLLAALDASDFISILLDEIFFTVITILAVLAIILIYSLLLADVEEKTFEYGLIRCLGITQKVIMELLFTQATTFAVPAILLALLLSFWLK